MAQPRKLDPSESPAAFYGAELRRLREAAGLSQDRLGERVYCSGTYLGQIEAGIRKPQLDLSGRLDDALGTGGHFARLYPLAARTGHAAYFARAADLEAQAVAISEYAPTLVPGLLQTEAYARAVITAANPTAPREDVAERVKVRLQRAQVLDDPTTPVLWFILHESVLRLPVGGPGTVGEQLSHISGLAASGRIIVQIIPYAAGAHAVAAGMASLMEFPDAPPVVYVEGLHTGQLLDEPALVSACRRSYDLARAVALSPAASLALIKSVTEEQQ